MLAAYGERRAWLMPALTEAGFTYGHPGGAFYIYTNVGSVGLPAPDFCERLLKETGVMVFPGTMFGDHLARLHPDQLPAAAAEDPRGDGPDRRLHETGEGGGMNRPDRGDKFVGIQCSPISFVDEGVAAFSTRCRPAPGSMC